ncbi:hypothetical protein FGU46_01230 [Methanobacterium sp. CWC-01]|uniref:CDC27 family protein n=1 Tax=Methanobacterium aridiramus TaxID=2584467 RepID=UPI002578ADAF|nr:CDC27 family protein [Methanobacterium sp. CWC-01]WJI08810.1 hypothetical protein FGU46_01230 [Methanobacterium sp. CWC-01]
MVSNEDIKKNLKLKRKGIDPDDPKQKVLAGIYSQMKENETRSKSEKNPLDRICPKCGVKNYLTSVKCIECGENLPELSADSIKTFSNRNKTSNKGINSTLKESINLNQTNQKDIKKAKELIKKGNDSFTKGKFKDALIFFNKATEKDPNSIEAYNFKVSTLLALNKPTEALEYIEKSIDIDPKNPGSWMIKGIVLVSLQKYEESIACYDQTLKLKPDLITALFQKGSALLNVPGRENEGKECLKQFIERAPTELENLKMAANQLINDEFTPMIQIQGGDKQGKVMILTTEMEGIRIQRKGLYTGWDKGTQFIRYNDITSIGFKKGLVLGTLEISVPGARIKVRSVNSAHGVTFTNIVQKKVQQVKSKPQQAETVRVEQKLSPMDEIKKAKELLDIGAINQSEFEEIKNKYMEKI